MNDDPDLPGDANFTPVGNYVDSRGRQWIAKSIPEQAAIHHNQMRYAELQKLRRGETNAYLETRYRR